MALVLFVIVGLTIIIATGITILVLFDACRGNYY